MAPVRILLQLDPDPQASTFDAVVAFDAGVEQLIARSGVTPEQVRDLVYGTIFTRGVDQLRRTAIFVGGSKVAAGEALLREVTRAFAGPFRVSVLFDANGANTTAAAAVLSAGKHLALSGCTAVVLGATGPVGLRASRLLAREGAQVRLASRDLARAEAACRSIAAQVNGAALSAHGIGDQAGLSDLLEGAQLVLAAGAPGVQLLGADRLFNTIGLEVAIDLNAVPPLGIAGVEVSDKTQERGGIVCYGALGIGGRKMKIHKAALSRLFEANDLVLDAEEVYALGKELG